MKKTQPTAATMVSACTPPTKFCNTKGHWVIYCIIPNAISTLKRIESQTRKRCEKEWKNVMR